MDLCAESAIDGVVAEACTAERTTYSEVTNNHRPATANPAHIRQHPQPMDMSHGVILDENSIHIDKKAL